MWNVVWEELSSAGLWSVCCGHWRCLDVEGALGAFSDLWEATCEGRVHFPCFFAELEQLLGTVRQPEVSQVMIRRPKGAECYFQMISGADYPFLSSSANCASSYFILCIYCLFYRGKKPILKFHSSIGEAKLSTVAVSKKYLVGEDHSNISWKPLCVFCICSSNP